MAGEHEAGPLILGTSGRLGQAFRRLWDGGHWPARAEPIWQQRAADPTGAAITWDLLTQAPPAEDRLRRATGLIVLAGVTAGDKAALAANTALALAAIDLADELRIGPVLLCSSTAVYGRAIGPQSEAADCQPANPYGAAKLAMEQAVAGRGAICLRIANVAGSDQLFQAAAHGGVRLDRFADGKGPERAYIGPRTLAETMLRLIALAKQGTVLTPVLNIAAPAPVTMEAVLQAADVPFDWTEAPATALPSVTLDTRLLSSIAALAPATAHPATLVAEARAAGWRPGS